MELVRLGPKSLPYLLESANFPTPTGIRYYSGMYTIPRSFIPLANAENAREAKLMASQPDGIGQSSGEAPGTVSVGDVCKVAIGQITGRNYQNRMFCDSMDTVIPMGEPVPTAAALRSLWSGGDISKRLHESLLLDFRSRDRPDSDTSHSREKLDEKASYSDTWQLSAAQRLLYYFPRKSVPLIVARLKGLRIRNDRVDWKTYTSDSAQRQ